MDNHKIIKLNRFISNAYQCSSFTEYLKLAIMKLNELVPYESGMFYCSISKDCSFFKPYAGGNVEGYYQKHRFTEKDDYLDKSLEEDAGSEALVYKSLDYRQGTVIIGHEPRSSFLSSQEDFYIVCVRIVYKGLFMGEIYLHRSKDKPDFDEEDMFTLRLLQPHISTVFQIIHTVTAANYLETNNERMGKKGLCLLDQDLSLTGGNVSGMEMLKTSTVFGSSVLFHVKELCTNMLSETKEDTYVLQRTEKFKTGCGNLLTNVLFSTRCSSKEGGRFFLVMEFEDEEQRNADYKLKFSKREGDIIDGIIQGKNNAQLATTLHLSENTIKTHIRNIYRKAGANNRTELAYILMLNG